MSRLKVKGQGHQGQNTGFMADISGISGLICDKFTGKMCLVLLSDKFEGHGQRPKVKVTRDKKGVFGGSREPHNVLSLELVKI